MEPKLKTVLGQKVRGLRQAKGWTQAHLAQVSGLDERTVRRIESGTVPSLESLQALAQALEVDCAELKRYADTTPTPKATVQIVPVSSGREFFGAIDATCAMTVDADDAETDDERDLVRTLLDLMEYGEIWDDIDPAGRYDAEQKVSKVLRQLNAKGWGVCVERRRGTLQTSHGPIANWITTRIRIAKVNPELTRIFQEAMTQAEGNETSRQAVSGSEPHA